MLPTTLALSILSQTSDTVSSLETWRPLIEMGLTLVGGLLLWLLRTYGKALSQWVAQKTHSEFLGEVVHRAELIVYHFYQTRVKKIKGTEYWTEALQKEILQDAVSALKIGLDTKKLNALAGELGVEVFLEGVVEANVLAAKTKGRAAANLKPESADPTKG